MSERHTGDTGRPSPGRDGVAARRAIVRWAWRMFRREWRQQSLVLGLLTVAVSAAIVSASSAYNLAPVSGNAEFGDASHFLSFDGSAPELLEADLAAASEWFGHVEAITAQSVLVPGAFDRLDVRGQDPEGPYSGPTLALRSGRYPTAGDEVAVTDRVARTFNLEIGASLVIEGAPRAVVGIVENPNDLRDEFVLVNPLSEQRPDSVTILVQAEDDHVFGFRSASMMARSARGAEENLATFAALSMLGTASVGLVFVGLVTTVSFTVLAQRRLRQLGMLAAVGATEQHLRLVTVANGVVVGLVAALTGTAVGLASWIALVPLLEEPFGHRIDRFEVPWWLVAAAVLLAVITATAAAWWPARAMARIPVTNALSGRPPQPKATRWSMTVATTMTAAGMLVLVLAGPESPVLVVVGSLCTIIGVLLFSPLIVRMAAGPAARLPVAARLALRDVARYQARSGAAVAAVSLAFGMAASITIIASAEEHGRQEGNLAAEQLMVRIGDPEAPILPPDFSPFVPDLSDTELLERQLGVDEISALLDAARVIALDVAFDPHLGVDERFDAWSAVTLAEFVSQGPRPGYPDLSLLYVASPETLGHYGVDLSRLDPSTEVLTTENGDLWFSGLRREPGVEPPPVVSPVRLTERHTSLPGSFITSAALQEHGWDVMRSGWLVEAAGPVTGAQVAAAREIAARSGLTIEFKDEQEDLLALRFQATAGGTLVALAVIAMTVGLIRAEAARDLRTLTATGATSATRRALTATTAAALAVLGAVVGISGAYAVLGAGYLDASSLLSSIPWMHLGLTMLGAPFAAGLMGWLMAGGEQRALTRQPIE